MPPKEKKKKLSKKEKEALKRAEQERLAEEQRLADLAEAERLEKERLQREEEARIAAEIAAQKAAELEERRVIEDKENAPLYDQLAEKLETEAAKRGYAEEWGKYVACDSLPDVQSEAQVNTYITEWSETQATDLAHGLAEVERTGVVLSLLEESWQLARHERLRLLPRAPAQQPAAGAEEPGGAARGEAEEMWQPGALAQLASMTIEKLDEATGHILMHADELATTRNELQRAHEGGYLRYGLWVNLARNVRVKNVELPEISVSLELPKTLALAAVAITVHQFKHAHCSPSFAAPSQWIPLGGVTIIELLALPPIPKKVKGWTLRQVGTSGASVQRLAYPIPTVGGDTGTQSGVLPMRVTLNLGDDCVLQQPPPAHAAAAPTAPAGGAEGGKPEEGAAAPAPAELEDLTVGWWDADAREWSLDGVSEVKFSAATRTLSFLTTHLAPLAVLRPSHAELPYRRWLLTPLSPSHSVLAVQTQSNLVVIDTNADGCRLQEPSLPQLSALLGVRMQPALLLLRLRQAGINLSPADQDARPIPALEPKESSFEEELLSHLVLLAPALRLASSKWNASRDTDKACVRVTAQMPQEADDDLLPSAEPKAVDHFAGYNDYGWSTLLYAHRYAAIMQSGESDAAMALDVHGKEELARGEVAHGTPLNCLKETHPDSLQALTQSSAHYQKLLLQLLAQMRLFSFTHTG